MSSGREVRAGVARSVARWWCNSVTRNEIYHTATTYRSAANAVSTEVENGEGEIKMRPMEECRGRIHLVV